LLDLESVTLLLGFQVGLGLLSGEANTRGLVGGETGEGVHLELLSGEDLLLGENSFLVGLLLGLLLGLGTELLALSTSATVLG
jgi:hypothetical protein